TRWCARWWRTPRRRTCWRAGVARLRELVRSWLAEHSVEVATVGAAWLAAWVVVKAGGELLVWWRARRQATAACCAGCGGAVEVMAYPPAGDPVACCWVCFDRLQKRLETDAGEPAPWVRLDRPDLMYLAG